MSEKKEITPQTIARLMSILYGSMDTDAEDHVLMSQMVESTMILMMILAHREESTEHIIDVTAEAILMENCGRVDRCRAYVVENPHGTFVFGDIMGSGDPEEKEATHALLADALIEAGYDLHIMRGGAGEADEFVGHTKGLDTTLDHVFRKAHERATEKDIEEFKGSMDSALESWLGGDSDE